MKRLEKIAVVLLIATGLFFQFYYFDFILDDPFISFRYAYNLIHGNGFVYNIGERVEGYSNFLWTLMVAAFMAFNADPVLVSKLLGMVFSIGTVILVFYLPGTILEDTISRTVGFLSVCLVVTNWYFNLWTIGGLETPLYTFLLIGSIFIFVRELKNPSFPFSAIPYALLCMTRPEGILFAGIAGLFRIFIAFKHGKFRNHDIQWAMIIFILCGGYFLWRLTYYGAILPNTFYAKTGGGVEKYFLGFDYVSSFLSSGGIIFSILIITGVSLFVCVFFKNVCGIFFLGNIFAQLSFIILVGGDWMSGYRFFVPIIPMISICAVIGIYHLTELIRPLHLKLKGIKVSYIMYGMVIILGGDQLWFHNIELKKQTPWLSSWFYSLSLEPRGSYYDVATFLRNNISHGSAIALGEAGVIPYYCPQLRVTDFLGIVDTHIAHVEGLLHHKTDVNYILERKPDWILLIVVIDSPATIKGLGLPVQQILKSDLFNEQYTLANRIKRNNLKDFVDYFYIYKRINQKSLQMDYEFATNFDDGILWSPPGNMDNPWHTLIAKDTFTIRNDKKAGILAIAPSLLAYELNVESQSLPVLSFGIGIFEQAWTWGGDGVTFQISLIQGSSERIIFDKYLNPCLNEFDRKWHYFSFPVTNLEHGRLLISFITKNGPRGDGTADWSIWANPILKLTEKSSRKIGEDKNL